jgi:hypothetical protein
MIDLLNTHSLTFYRDGDGGVDLDGNFVEGIRSPISTKGSLQPFRESRGGMSMKLLQQGLEVDDSKVYYTKSNLNTVDEYAERLADYTEIGGIKYVVSFKADWTGYGLDADHYMYILARRGKATE